MFFSCSDSACVVDDFSTRGRRLLWFSSHSGQTKACVQNTNKAARLGDCPWQAASSGKYHLLCWFLDYTTSAPLFYLSLKTQHSMGHVSTFSLLRTKVKTLVREHVIILGVMWIHKSQSRRLGVVWRVINPLRRTLYRVWNSKGNKEI